ncbi:hypothetical protein PBS_36820 [Paraburkholderia sp. 2C]|jgi:multidrug efflux pump
MDFSKFFIDRPIFAVVLSIIMFAVGLIAIPLLPAGEYPEVVPPTVVVHATYPGANPWHCDAVSHRMLTSAVCLESVMACRRVMRLLGEVHCLLRFEVRQMKSDPGVVR